MNQTPEQMARDNIDRQLSASGWIVQSRKRMNLNAGFGVTVREYRTDAVSADYALFVDVNPVGIIAAKREEEGARLTAHEDQSKFYAERKLKCLNNDPLPFEYESTGQLTCFTGYCDPKPRSRPAYLFHRLKSSFVPTNNHVYISTIQWLYALLKNEELSKSQGILGQIFTKSQNKIQDPAKLFNLVDMMDKEEQWSMMGADVKGKIYEGLLEKNAEDTKSGAGQYFTPRALIKAMVACFQPRPMKTIDDSDCGIRGFILAAYDYISNRENFIQDKEQKEFLKHKTFYGNEIVASACRMALKNLFLRNIGDIADDNFISTTDSLVSDTGFRADYVLTNPPFGKKSSHTFTDGQGEQKKEDLTYKRQDFCAATSNKQLNFCSTYAQFSNQTEKPPSYCPTTCCLKAEPARSSGKTAGNNHPTDINGKKPIIRKTIPMAAGGNSLTKRLFLVTNQAWI